jgi:hypothetical protein
MARRGLYQNSGKISMPDNTAKVPRVEFTPEFKRNVRQLAKKYRHLQPTSSLSSPNWQLARLQGHKYQGRAVQSSKCVSRTRIFRRESGRDTAWFITSKLQNWCS